jgi:hypothetical protein
MTEPIDNKNCFIIQYNFSDGRPAVLEENGIDLMGRQWWAGDAVQLDPMVEVDEFIAHNTPAAVVEHEHGVKCGDEGMEDVTFSRISISVTTPPKPKHTVKVNGFDVELSVVYPFVGDMQGKTKVKAGRYLLAEFQNGADAEFFRDHLMEVGSVSYHIENGVIQ